MIRRDTMRMLTGQTSANLRIFYLRKIRVENLSARWNEHFEIRNNFGYPIRYVSEYFRLDHLSRMVCVLYDRYTTLNEKIFRSKMKNLRNFFGTKTSNSDSGLIYGIKGPRSWKWSGISPNLIPVGSKSEHLINPATWFAVKTHNSM